MGDFDIYLVFIYPLLLFCSAHFGDRTNLLSILCFQILPIIYFIYLMKLVGNVSYKKIFFYSIFLRLVVVGASPVWSDDIYRYLWDASLLSQKINYFEYSPNEFEALWVSVSKLESQLLQNMNSTEYLSVYPPLLVFVYSIPIYFFSDIFFIIITLQLLWIVVDAIIFYLLRKWFTIGSKSLWFYMGNPLVILESIGQLHPEILLSILILVVVKYQYNRLSNLLLLFGLMNVKISYLMYLPVLIRFENWKRILVLSISFLTVGIFLFLFFDAVALQLKKGLGLFFHSFRFHGILESPIFWILEYFKSSYLSGVVSLFCFGSFSIWFVWKTRNLSLPLEISLYYITLAFLLFTPVFHPWYLIPLILLTVLIPNLQNLSSILMIFSGFSYILYAFQEFSVYLTLTEIFILFFYVRKSHHHIFQKT